MAKLKGKQKSIILTGFEEGNEGGGRPSSSSTTSSITCDDGSAWGPGSAKTAGKVHFFFFLFAGALTWCTVLRRMVTRERMRSSAEVGRLLYPTAFWVTCANLRNVFVGQVTNRFQGHSRTLGASCKNGIFPRCYSSTPDTGHPHVAYRLYTGSSQVRTG